MIGLTRKFILNGITASLILLLQQPIMADDFVIDIGFKVGNTQEYGTANLQTVQIGNDIVAVSGTLTVSAGPEAGTYALIENPMMDHDIQTGQVSVGLSPDGHFFYDNVVSAEGIPFDYFGLQFVGTSGVNTGFDVNLWEYHNTSGVFEVYNGGYHAWGMNDPSGGFVPEPSSCALLGIGGIGLAIRALRRRGSKSAV